MFSFTSKLKRLPFFLTTLAVTLIFGIVCISIVDFITGRGLTTSISDIETWGPYLITFMVTVVVLSLVETVAIIRRVNDITDGRLLVSVLVAALFVILLLNSLFGDPFELYIFGFIAVCAVLFFVPSNLIKSPDYLEVATGIGENVLKESGMFSFTSKLKRLPFFLTTLAVTLIFGIVCISIVCLPLFIAGSRFSIDWTPYLITFDVTVVFLSLVEGVAIIRRVNDITDGRLLVSVLVAALSVILLLNSLFGGPFELFELYVCGFIAVVLFFVPSNLIKKS